MSGDAAPIRGDASATGVKEEDIRIHEGNQERADTAKPLLNPDVRALLQVFLFFAEQGMVPGTGTTIIAKSCSYIYSS